MVLVMRYIWNFVVARRMRKMKDDNNLDNLKIIEEPKPVAVLKYTCATCKYEDYSPESSECAWCVDAGPNGGWKTEKGSWEPKEDKGE